MKSPLVCPTCSGSLGIREPEAFECDEGHQYTVVGLALTTNIAAVRALWMGIRALEEDAAGLEYMATHYGDQYGMSAEKRREEAAAAQAAVEVLRVQARRAQERLDALPIAPSAIREREIQAGQGG